MEFEEKMLGLLQSGFSVQRFSGSFRTIHLVVSNVLISVVLRVCLQVPIEPRLFVVLTPAQFHEGQQINTIKCVEEQRHTEGF